MFKVITQFKLSILAVAPPASKTGVAAKVAAVDVQSRNGTGATGEILVIAPEGDKSLYHYENDAQARKRNLTSGQRDRKVYVMVAKTENGMELTRFEPDEKYLNAVCIKYPQKVIR